MEKIADRFAFNGRIKLNDDENDFLTLATDESCSNDFIVNFKESHYKSPSNKEI